MEGLSLEQKILIKKGYHIFINDEGKFEEQQTAKSIDSVFQEAIGKIASGYSILEMNTWNEKEKEANVVFNGGASTFIEALCVEGETALELSEKILANAASFKNAYTYAERNKRMSLKLLKAL